MPKSVREIMSTKLLTIGMTETAKDAAKKMMDKNVSSLLVVDHDNLTVGIVTERDIVRGVCIHDGNSKDFRVHHVMSSPVSSIDPDSSVEAAASMMLQEKVRHLVVKDGDRLVGIITATNFIDYLDDELEPDNAKARIIRTLKDEV
ncbi:MAG: cyclic nucleotide-binding/CBS domain-containing protein [Candidatus Eiseniibacteriota bacterium]